MFIAPSEDIATLKQWIVLFGIKRTQFRREKDRIRVMVFGSSHGELGFIGSADDRSFNMCHPSQDLKHAFHLYRRLGRECPRLSTVVLFYSVFSPGFMLEMLPSEQQISLAGNELFDLGLEYQSPKLQGMAASLRGRLDAVDFDKPGYSGGYMERPIEQLTAPPSAAGGAERARKHLKYCAPQPVHGYFEQFVTLARLRGHRLLVVITPVRSEYREACFAQCADPFAPLHEEMARLNDGAPDAIELIDMFADPRFENHDFFDYDHLIPRERGARIVTDTVLAHIGHARNGQAAARA